MRVKIPRCGLIKLSTLYALSGILVSLSLDRNRVLCHLQDPIKSITLVFSLVYYFFFCRKSECLDECTPLTFWIFAIYRDREPPRNEFYELSLSLFFSLNVQ
jgi:hypothetical protein